MSLANAISTSSTIVYTNTSHGIKILPLLDPESNVEEAAVEYRRGGYLPISIGDKFANAKYVVVRKLGWGHFSTVWLVKDTISDRHCALKVVKSARRYAETALDEVKILKTIQQQVDDRYNGRDRIVQLLDSFEHLSRGDLHVCMVFEPLGETLLTVIEKNKTTGLSQDLVKSIVKQILTGLAFLHESCDLVHTDIKPENILLSIPNVEEHIRVEILSGTTPVSRHVGIPIEPRRGASTTVRRVDRARDRVRIFDSQPIPSPLSKLSPLAQCPLEQVGTLISTMQIARNISPGSVSGGHSPNDTGFSTAPTSLGSTSRLLSSRSQISITESLSSDQLLARVFSPKQSQKASLLSQTLPSTLPEIEPLYEVNDSESKPDYSDTNETPPQGGTFLSPPHLPQMPIFLEDIDLKVKIADLGNASPSKAHYTEDIQTRQYRAPEAILGRTDWDAKADIWSVACLTFELFTGDVLFDPQPRKGQHTKDDDHMAMIIELLGEDSTFELDFKMGGRYSSELFDEQGTLRCIKELHHWPLHRVFVEKYLREPELAEKMCDFLHPMLAINPKDRSSAVQMIEHQWLQQSEEET